MTSQHLNRNIILRACFLALNAIANGWLIFDQKIYVLAIFFTVIFIFQVIELINFLNRTNRKIAWFFDAIRNEDSTLNFPDKTGNKALNELNASLNKVNELIKKIKFDLRVQEQYFQTILENVSIGILTHNEKGNIFLANSAAKNLLGREHLTHINQISQIDRKLYMSVKELQPGDRRLVSFKSKQGIIQLSLKSTKFTTSRESLQLISIQDIKNEMETKELESWIKLIRVLTHEIMNTVAPITSLSETIMGYYKNLEGKVPNEKIIGNTLKGLEVINERGAGLISFVETYRKLTRLPPPEKKPLQVKQLLESTITLINLETINENIQIKWDVNPENLEIAADKKQVSQVLINLLKNALEALKNKPGGTILLKGEIKSDGRAQISVTDNGPGIQDDLMDKIFVPFFTTKESGSGIGLSLSRQIMLLHGGSLKVNSIPGKLTTMSLVF